MINVLKKYWATWTASRFNIFPLIAVTLLTTQSANAFDFLTDPLDTTGSISATPAKNMLPASSNSCYFIVPIPSPLTLLDAVERALCRNPKTRQAWSEVKAQAAAVGIDKAAYLPTLNATGSYSNFDKNTSYPGYQQFDFKFNAKSSDVAYNLNWVLYDFGLRGANLTVSRQLLNAANAMQDETVLNVFFNTVKDYDEAQGAFALVTAMTQAEDVSEQSFKSAEAMYAAGTGSLADELQAQTAYMQAKLKRVKAEGAFLSARGNLAIMIGLTPSIFLQLSSISRENSDDPFFGQAVDDLIAEAIHDHPKVLVALAQLKAAQAQIDADHATGRPTVSLFVTGDRNNTPLEIADISEVLSSRSIGVQITVPLFDGFVDFYKVRQAEAQAEDKKAALEDAERQVSLEVWQSYQALHTETENLKTTEMLSRSAKQSFDVALGRYKSGVGSILELLKAQSELANANQQRILALTQWKTARFRLASSLAQLRISDIQ